MHKERVYLKKNDTDMETVHIMKNTTPKKVASLL